MKSRFQRLMLKLSLLIISVQAFTIWLKDWNMPDVIHRSIKNTRNNKLIMSRIGSFQLCTTDYDDVKYKKGEKFSFEYTIYGEASSIFLKGYVEKEGNDWKLVGVDTTFSSH